MGELVGEELVQLGQPRVQLHPDGQAVAPERLGTEGDQVGGDQQPVQVRGGAERAVGAEGQEHGGTDRDVGEDLGLAGVATPSDAGQAPVTFRLTMRIRRPPCVQPTLVM